VHRRKNLGVDPCLTFVPIVCRDSSTSCAMEERADVDGSTDVDENSGNAAVVRHRDPEPQETRTTSTGAVRRYSLADFRRRDTTTDHHGAASTQLRGLVIPSPAGGARGKPSACFLPTIAGTKLQSQLLLTSSALERRGGEGSCTYRSPFISTSLLNASGVSPRRSSAYGYPFSQNSSAFSTSDVKPSGMAQCVNENFAYDDGKMGGANDPDVAQHSAELISTKSGRPSMSPDATGSLNHSTRLADGDEETAADSMLLLQDTSNSPPTVRKSLEVSQDPSSTELSLELNSLKVGCNQRKEEDIRDVEHLALPTSNAKLTPSECQTPDSPLDYSVVSPITALQTQPRSSANDDDSGLISFTDCTNDDSAASSTGRDRRKAANVDSNHESSSSSKTSTSERCEQSQLDDGDLNATDATVDLVTPYHDTDSGSAATTQVVISKGNLGLGFCIAGGRGSMTDDNRIVVKRIFKGTPTPTVTHTYFA